MKTFIARAFVAAQMLICLSMAACNGDSADDERKVVEAPIESIDILVRESFPPGYTAKITSGLPSGCARFHGARIANRVAETITVKVTNTLPAEDGVPCTAIYGYHEANVDLGQDFVSGQTYTVKANDKEKTFTAQ